MMWVEYEYGLTKGKENVWNDIWERIVCMHLEYYNMRGFRRDQL